MTNDQVEQDLVKRISDSKQWIKSSPQSLDGFTFRNRIWTATPEVFLDDAKRVERNGVGFRFSLDDDDKQIAVQLNVRIKPHATIGPKADSPPLVVVYVVNQTTGADDCLMFQHLSPASTYVDLLGLSLEDWYRKWILAGVKCKSSRKILGREMSILA